MSFFALNGSNGACLAGLFDEIGNSRRLIVASNRGPIEYHVSEDGRLQATKAGGGVAIALSALSRYMDFTWVACAMGEGDRYAAEVSRNGTLITSLDGHRSYLRFVLVPKGTYDKYYSVFSNTFLWFFQHKMLNHSCNTSIDQQVWDAWENGYVPANQAFAEAVVAEADGEDSPYVMVHDYHLYLTPGLIRARLPHALIHHFIHIPWPACQQWMILPISVSRSICQSLCSCDIVGLQTTRDVDNFLYTCEFALEEARVDHQERTIHFNGHQTKVNAYPISVDVAELQRLANSEEVIGYEQKIRPFLGRKTIVRVDRVEPTKNILLGFEAYDMLLARNPHLLGQVSLLAFMVPSRTNLKQYQEYTHEVFALVNEINTKYGRDGWNPINLFYEHNYPQAIAGMRLYDVLLVNPVADGMNLVAKEGPIVNTKNGVLVLSEEAGAAEQLRDGAISIDPTNVEGTVEALCQALDMPMEEKRSRAEKLRKKIKEEDITHWFWRQLKDLHTVAERLPIAIR